LIFGWNVDYILNMPAVRFFSMLNSAKKIKYRERAHFMMQLCDVAAVSIGGKDYFDIVRKQFYHAANGTEEMLDGKRALDPTDKTTQMAVSAIFAVAQGGH
jgi:hypothetical protein